MVLAHVICKVWGGGRHGCGWKGGFGSYHSLIHLRDDICLSPSFFNVILTDHLTLIAVSDWYGCVRGTGTMHVMSTLVCPAPAPPLQSHRFLTGCSTTTAECADWVKRTMAVTGLVAE